MSDLSAASFTLLQGAHVYAPQDRGICDVLLANGKIIAIEATIPMGIVPDCTIVNLHGHILCPGFIDQHVMLKPTGSIIRNVMSYKCTMANSREAASALTAITIPRPSWA